MKKTGKILTACAVTLTLTVGSAAGLYFYSTQLVKVDGTLYRRGIEPLDLREEEISITHYENLQKAFPQRKILWKVPFQQRFYDCDVEKITVTSLSQADAEILAYLPDLKQVDASNCFDYEGLQRLRQLKPDCRIDSFVAVDGQILPWNAENLEFSQGRGNFTELMKKLAYLPELKTVSFQEPRMTAEQLNALRETYPKVEFFWTKRLFGKLYNSEQRILDISGMKFKSIEEVESQTDYLPKLQKLIMCDSGLEYEDIAAYRERSRERFQVVFNVIIKNMDVRTDIVRFVPSEWNVAPADHETRYLKYCEDLVYVDLSRCVVRNIDWAWGTPHLQYLIIKDSPLRDIQALRNLKELKLLELSKVDLRDMRPLLDCEALEDLMITGAFPDIGVLGHMTWLQNLWINGNREELRSMLPGTAVHAENESGWKNLNNYIYMQAIQDPLIPNILLNPPKKPITPGFVIPRM